MAKQKPKEEKPSYRFDILQWRREQTGETYRAIASRCDKLSVTAVYDIVNGNVDPTTSTLKKTFIASGLDPKFALDDTLRTERDFRRAVARAAR